MTDRLIVVHRTPIDDPESRGGDLADYASGLVVRSAPDTDGLADLALEVEVVLGFWPPDLFDSSPKLRWVQLMAAGADWYVRHNSVMSALQSGRVTLTTASGVHEACMSEHVFMMLLALVRRLKRSLRNQASHAWEKGTMDEFGELWGRRLTVVGAGAVGRRVAALGAAFGMNVRVVRRNPDKPLALSPDTLGRAVEQVSVDNLDSVLPDTDVIVLAVPRTPETNALLGADQIARLPAGAIVCNVGRGNAVDEPALIEALRDGRLGGAGLDVFAAEPLQEDSPLWDMENVIVTPHNSGFTNTYGERLWRLFLDNFRRYETGEAMRNVFDPARMY